MGASASTLPDFLSEDHVRSLVGNQQFQLSVFEKHAVVTFQPSSSSQGGSQGPGLGGALAKSFPRDKLVELGRNTDIFISYDGELDEEGSFNHVRAAKINAALRKMGFVTKFPNDQLDKRESLDSIVASVDRSQLVLVVATGRYQDAIGGGTNGPSDDCMKEFKTALVRKSEKRMLVTAMDDYNPQRDQLQGDDDDQPFESSFYTELEQEGNLRLHQVSNDKSSHIDFTDYDAFDRSMAKLRRAILGLIAPRGVIRDNGEDGDLHAEDKKADEVRGAATAEADATMPVGFKSIRNMACTVTAKLALQNFKNVASTPHMYPDADLRALLTDLVRLLASQKHNQIALGENGFCHYVTKLLRTIKMSDGSHYSNATVAAIFEVAALLCQSSEDDTGTLNHDNIRHMSTESVLQDFMEIVKRSISESKQVSIKAFRFIRNLCRLNDATIKSRLESASVGQIVRLGLMAHVSNAEAASVIIETVNALVAVPSMRAALSGAQTSQNSNNSSSNHKNSSAVKKGTEKTNGCDICSLLVDACTWHMAVPGVIRHVATALYLIAVKRGANESDARDCRKRLSVSSSGGVFTAVISAMVAHLCREGITSQLCALIAAYADDADQQDRVKVQDRGFGPTSLRQHLTNANACPALVYVISWNLNAAELVHLAAVAIRRLLCVDIGVSGVAVVSSSRAQFAAVGGALVVGSALRAYGSAELIAVIKWTTWWDGRDSIESEDSGVVATIQEQYVVQADVVPVVCAMVASSGRQLSSSPSSSKIFGDTLSVLLHLHRDCWSAVERSISLGIHVLLAQLLTASTRAPNDHKENDDDDHSLLTLLLLDNIAALARCRSSHSNRDGSPHINNSESYQELLAHEAVVDAATNLLAHHTNYVISIQSSNLSNNSDSSSVAIVHKVCAVLADISQDSKPATMKLLSHKLWEALTGVLDAATHSFQQGLLSTIAIPLLYLIKVLTENFDSASNSGHGTLKTAQAPFLGCLAQLCCHVAALSQQAEESCKGNGATVAASSVKEAQQLILNVTTGLCNYSPNRMIICGHDAFMEHFVSLVASSGAYGHPEFLSRLLATVEVLTDKCSPVAARLTELNMGDHLALAFGYHLDRAAAITPSVSSASLDASSVPALVAIAQMLQHLAIFPFANRRLGMTPVGPYLAQQLTTALTSPLLMVSAGKRHDVVAMALVTTIHMLCKDANAREAYTTPHSEMPLKDICAAGLIKTLVAHVFNRGIAGEVCLLVQTLVFGSCDGLVSGVAGTGITAATVPSSALSQPVSNTSTVAAAAIATVFIEEGLCGALVKAATCHIAHEHTLELVLHTLARIVLFAYDASGDWDGTNNDTDRQKYHHKLEDTTRNRLVYAGASVIVLKIMKAYVHKATIAEQACLVLHFMLVGSSSSSSSTSSISNSVKEQLLAGDAVLTLCDLKLHHSESGAVMEVCDQTLKLLWL